MSAKEETIETVFQGMASIPEDGTRYNGWINNEAKKKLNKGQTREEILYKAGHGY